METQNVALALQLLITLTTQAQALAQLLTKAREQQRDITKEELDQLVSDDEAAKAEFQRAIDAARADEVK